MANATYLRTAVFAIAMVIGGVGAHLLKPRPMYTPESPPPVNLTQAVPAQFGGWREDTQRHTMIVSPEVEQMLKDLYSDNLSRTYVNARGDRVMLALAYGADQSRSLQVHKPEVCYEAQGFRISDTRKEAAATEFGPLPVMRVLTTKGNRQEPVTYWIRSGDAIVRGWFEQNVARVKAGLAGYHPDGILVRISTLDANTQNAYAVQDAFIKDLVAALPPEGRRMLLGHDFISTNAQQHAALP